jgi:hypothetical protein
MAKISKNNIYAIKYLFSQNFTTEQCTICDRIRKSDKGESTTDS